MIFPVEVEELFLIAGGLLLFFDIISVSMGKSHRKYSFYTSIIACSLILVCYVSLLTAFLRDDFSLQGVYFHSSVNVPQVFKFAATWSSAGGSMLFLSVLLSILNLMYRFMTYNKGSRFTETYRILDIILLLSIIFTFINSPFERLSEVPINGKGFNPLLQSFWMLVHPPLIFVSYVGIFFACVLTLANVKTQGNEDNWLLSITLRIAWLATTLGIATGGLWAYEVQGWGGYWNWDPVETASLLPWLALTTYFHVGSLRGTGDRLVREVIIVIALESVLFTTALTRGRLLLSVHAYAPSILQLVLLLLPMVIVGGYFFHLLRTSHRPHFSLKVDGSSLLSVSGIIGFVALICIYLVCLIGLLFPILIGFITASPIALTTDFYNWGNYLPVLGLLIALVGMSIHQWGNTALFAVLITSAFGVGGALVLSQWPTSARLTNFSIPLLAITFLTSTWKLIQECKKKALQSFGRSLLHFAVIILLIGIFVSSSANRVVEIPSMKVNTPVETLGLQIELRHLSLSLPIDRVFSLELNQSVPEYASFKIDVVMTRNWSKYERSLEIRLYSMYGIVSSPVIIHTPTEDLYLRIQHTESLDASLRQALEGFIVLPDNFLVTVEIIPLVNLIWLAVGLFSFGISLSLIDALKQSYLSLVERTSYS